MAFSVAQIAKNMGAPFAGNGDLQIARAAEPGAAGAQDLALAMDAKYSEQLAKTRARVAVLWEGADWQAMGLEAAIFVARPRLAMARITAIFDRPPCANAGVHASAAIDDSARIDENASIGAFVSIGANVVIGRNVRILPHVVIGEDVTIGADALIHAGVVIGAGVTIGDRFIAQPNATIGGDGFSFVTPEDGAIEAVRATMTSGTSGRGQAYLRIHSNASVRIGDDVEVGSSTAIDSGTIADTVIGSGTKIDNQVQIGHNVRIGAHCLICGQTGIAGSVVVGDFVVLAGGVGVADHVNIGDGVIVGVASTVMSNIPKGRAVLGSPAVKIEQSIASYKSLRRLPRVLARLEALQKQVSKLIDRG